MDGHQAAQDRVSNPSLTFLRSLALAVADQNRLGEHLNASQLYEVADAADIAVPGLRGPDEEQGKRQIGTIMARLFKDTETVTVETYEVSRQETETRREGGGPYIAKTYTFRTTAQPAQDLVLSCID